jgi:hypothetical protein
VTNRAVFGHCRRQRLFSPRKFPRSGLTGRICRALLVLTPVEAGLHLAIGEDGEMRTLWVGRSIGQGGADKMVFPMEGPQTPSSTDP